MSFPRIQALAAWLLAAAGALSTGNAWASDAQAGTAHPWVLLAVFWGAALLSVAVHYLLLYLVQAVHRARRSWERHAALRGRLKSRAEARAAQAFWAMSDALGLVGQSWDKAMDAARRTLEPHVAGARRAPGTLLGWSRSALKALRA